MRDDYGNTNNGSTRNPNWDPSSSPRNSKRGSSKTPSLTRRFDYPSQNRSNGDSRLDFPQKKEIRVSTTPLKADFVDHVNIPLRSKYLSGQRLLKKWCVRNIGADAWDESVTLKFTKGDGTLPTKKTFNVPHCESGQLCELSALIQTPEKPGRYTAYFRLNRGDTNFGPRIWVDVHVVSTEEELTSTDDQTQKRLERIDNRASATRPPQRRSAPKLRSSQRRTKLTKSANKNTINLDLDGGSSGLGYVDIPVFSSSKHASGGSGSLRSSTLNIDAEEFKPSKSREMYDEQLKELKSMGFENKDHNRVLLTKHKGDITKVIEVLVAPNNV